jgi:hypothetical protein
MEKRQDEFFTLRRPQVKGHSNKVSGNFSGNFKYSNAGKEWGWQWVFPATSHYTDKITGERRRHYLHESVLQKAVKEACRKRGYPSRQARTRFGILLPRICWKTGMTFVLSRNSSDTATSALQ